jgi:hypothetical protein
MFNSPPSHPKDLALEQVQKELNEIKEAKNEERFYWICSIIILTDIFMFPAMQTWAAPISLMFLELLFLICLGRKWGVDHIWTITEKIIDKWNGGFKNSN